MPPFSGGQKETLGTGIWRGGVSNSVSSVSIVSKMTMLGQGRLEQMDYPLYCIQIRSNCVDSLKDDDSEKKGG